MNKPQSFCEKTDYCVCKYAISGTFPFALFPQTRHGITLIWLSIDSPNTQKEFPSYHELKSNNFRFRVACSMFFVLHVHEFSRYKAFMVFFFVSFAIDSTNHDNEMDESFVAGKVNIL
jgi:hypothetical protein